MHVDKNSISGSIASFVMGLSCWITAFNFRGSENSVIPPHFRVGKQPFNSIVLVMCEKQLCRGVENKNIQVRNTKTLSFSLLNSLPERKVKITYCSGCVFVFHSFFQIELTDKNLDCFYSDEAYIHLERYINSQNYRLWASENSNAFVENRLHPQKVGMWCAVSRKRVVGPFFFREKINAD